MKGREAGTWRQSCQVQVQYGNITLLSRYNRHSQENLRVHPELNSSYNNCSFSIIKRTSSKVFHESIFFFKKVFSNLMSEIFASYQKPNPELLTKYQRVSQTGPFLYNQLVIDEEIKFHGFGNYLFKKRILAINFG